MSEDKQEQVEGSQLSLIGHLSERRNRLSVAFLAFVVLFVITIMPLPGGGFNSSLSSQSSCSCRRRWPKFWKKRAAAG